MVDSASIQAGSSSSSAGDGFYHAARGEVFDAQGDQAIQGFDAERMRARTYLTTAEEKKLIRRIDWHLLCSCLKTWTWIMCGLPSHPILYSLIDIHCKVSNARIMNRGTPQNIMTQLNLTSDEFALVTVLYYVRFTLLMLTVLRHITNSQIPRFPISFSKHPQICC